VVLSIDWHRPQRRASLGKIKREMQARHRGGAGERSGRSAVQRVGIIWGREVVSVGVDVDVDGCVDVLYVAPKPSDSSRRVHVWIMDNVVHGRELRVGTFMHACL
jgi:hypothetical protein